jgi:hypothetical protein
LTISECLDDNYPRLSWSTKIAKVVFVQHRSNCRFVEEQFTLLEIEQQTNLTHLKRVRRTGKKTDDGVNLIDIALCAASTMSEMELQAVIKDAEERGIEIMPRIEQVSCWPAYTTRQLSEFRALWPVSLRKDYTRC